MTDTSTTAAAPELAVPFTAPAEPVPAAAAQAATVVATVAADVAAVPHGNPFVAEASSTLSGLATDVAAGKGISDRAASIIRTATPSLVGAGITAAASAGVHIPVAYTGVIDLGAAFVIGLGYYALVRFIETKAPKAGWLLGVPTAPVYGA